VNRVSVQVEITEQTGERCDQLMSHILRSAFPSGAKAQVMQRQGEPTDVTGLGSLPTMVPGYVTTEYHIAHETPPEVDGSVEGIAEL
jgi:hypothetical protein